MSLCPHLFQVARWRSRGISPLVIRIRQPLLIPDPYLHDIKRCSGAPGGEPLHQWTNTNPVPHLNGTPSSPMSVLQEAGGDPMNSIPKIVSGGQTGADRAALDWALAHGVPCGG